MKKEIYHNETREYMSKNNWLSFGDGVYYNGNLFAIMTPGGAFISTTANRGGAYCRTWKNILPALKYADARPYTREKYADRIQYTPGARRYYARFDGGDSFIMVMATDDPHTGAAFELSNTGVSHPTQRKIQHADGMTAAELSENFPESVFTMDPYTADFDLLLPIK